MDTLELVQELEGTACRCGSKKASMQTFCKKDYYRLSLKQRQALYNRLGDGYEEAYADAIKTLDKD